MSKEGTKETINLYNWKADKISYQAEMYRKIRDSETIPEVKEAFTEVIKQLNTVEGIYRGLVIILEHT